MEEEELYPSLIDSYRKRDISVRNPSDEQRIGGMVIHNKRRASFAITDGVCGIWTGRRQRAIAR